MISRQPIPTVKASVISPRSATLAAQSTSKWRQKPMNTSLGWRSLRLPRVSWRLVGAYFSLLDRWQLIVDDWIWLVGSRFCHSPLQKFTNLCEENPFSNQGLPGLKSTNMNHEGRAKEITCRCRNNQKMPWKSFHQQKNWSFKKLSATKTIQSLLFQISF